MKQAQEWLGHSDPGHHAATTFADRFYADVYLPVRCPCFTPRLSVLILHLLVGPEEC